MDGIAYFPALILSLMTIFIWNRLAGKKKTDLESGPVEESGQSTEGNEGTESPDHLILTTPALSINPQRPLQRGFGVGIAVFVTMIIGTTLFQFFLQFALAPQYSNTLEFWTQGILAGLGWGTAVGVLPALAIGFLVWSKSAPIKTQVQRKNDLALQEKGWSVGDDLSSQKHIAEEPEAESARYQRNIMGFSLILFIPAALCIGFMVLGVWFSEK